MPVLEGLSQAELHQRLNDFLVGRTIKRMHATCEAQDAGVYTDQNGQSFRQKRPGPVTLTIEFEPQK